MYDSYSEVTRLARQASKDFLLGFARTQWAIILLIANTSLVLRWMVGMVRRKPVTVVIVLLFILAVSNIAIYASMKAKLTTAEWRYDRLRMHMDSVYEAYNIRNSYSRLVEYK